MSVAARFRSMLQDPRAQDWARLLYVFLLFWGLYLLSGCLKFTHFNAHVHLADAFLHGRFDLPDAPGHFEKTVFEGKTYLAYGIGPTLLMLPFVAVFGLTFHQAVFNAALAAAAVSFWYSTLGHMKLAPAVQNWLTALFGLGSLFWYMGGQNGNTWSLMHVGVCFGLMMAFNDVFGKKRGWVAGLGFGLAVLSRQTVFLALPFFLGMLWTDERALGGRGPILKLFGFGLALAALMGFNAFYNFARFHAPMDNGYIRVINDNAGQFPHGLFSLNYLEWQLKGYFLKLPDRIDHFPWFDPTMDGFSVFLSLPAMVFLLTADYRKRENWLAVLAILPIFAFYLVYHWSGYAQFGRRYSVDFLPFVMLLIASGVRNKVGTVLMATVIFGALVELWGLFWWGIKGW